jgi:outer membrane protein assembly factor BamB
MARGTLSGSGRSAETLRLPLAEDWQRSFDGTAFEATPVIADGICFVGDLDGGFHALRLDTGETAWSFRDDSPSGAGFAAAAAIAGGGEVPPLVVAGDANGLVRAFDRRSGEILWTHVREGEISGGLTITRSTEGERVLVGCQDASLACLDAVTGRLVWEVSIADQIRSSPTVADGRVLLAGCDGRLHVVDVETGRETAAVAIDGPTGTTPAAVGALAYFGSEGGIFWAIDATAAAVRWQSAASPGSAAYRSSAAIGGEPGRWLAIVGSRGRAVEAFAIADGSRAWRVPMRGRVDASPAIVRIPAGADGTAIEAAVVADAAGVVRLLRCRDGESLWEFDAGGGFTSSPAVATGRIILPSEDGTIWCFRGASGG